MSEDGQSGKPRPLTRREKIWTVLTSSLASLGFAYFLLGAVEGIRSQDSFRITYDEATKTAKHLSLRDEIKVEVVENSGSKNPNQVTIEIEKRRSGFSYIVAVMGGFFLFQFLWDMKKRNPGLKPEKWDPDLRG